MILSIRRFIPRTELSRIVTEVLTSSANDVYVVKTSDNRELLLPAIKECILDVDTANKKIIVHLMDGLL